jgi:hypothetical protein
MAFVILGILFVWCAVRLVKSNRSDILASASVAREQEINLPLPGVVLLLMEVPRTATDYRGFRIALIEKQTGQAETMKYSYLTAQGAVYGVTTMQVPFGRIMATRAGVYVARIEGLQPGKDYSRYRLLLSRPYLGRMARQIVALVLCGVGMLLSLIWAAWLAGLMQPG